MLRKKVIIMGAAGRDFHNFNVYFRHRDDFEVVAFTASQIPNIEGRVYPPELSGNYHPGGIPIFPEDALERLIREERVHAVVFAYSDVSHEYVMNRASRALSAGANFVLLSPEKTSLESIRPVISICAVRTGCGKSAATRYILGILKEMGKEVAAIRHPMPYGNLIKQRVQSFASISDLDRHECSIEEREEYEPLLMMGVPLFAGIDYGMILKEAEDKAQVIVWDGGNNDFPLIKSDLHFVLLDPLRPGHETAYHPGETNFRMADVLVISKMGSATPAGVERIRENIRLYNPGAKVVEADLKIMIEGGEERIRGKRVLVVEDGPTLTHGNMGYGAGTIAARRSGGEAVDPRPFLQGSLVQVFSEYPSIGRLLPAMGYSMEQIKDMEATIEKTPCDAVIVATPVDLRNIMEIRKEVIKVSYDLEELGKKQIRGIISSFLKERG